MKIGVFDSGLGGLSILRDILITLPEYDYVYLGDNARVPYGGRSPETIYQYTHSAVDYLFSQDCQLIILACNTASAVALRRIQQEYVPAHYPHRRVLGVIRPTIEDVALVSQRVGILATYATVASKSFVIELQKMNPELKVNQNLAPLLVPIIEEGKLDWLGLDLILEEYLEPLIKDDIDTLILGCTHYGLIADKIQQKAGPKVKVISQGPVVSGKLKDYLNRHPEIEEKLGKHGIRSYRVTDLNQRYENLTYRMLGENAMNGSRLELVRI